MSQRLRNEVSGLMETLDRSRAAGLRSISEGGLRLDVGFEVTSLYRGAHAAVEEREDLVVVRYQLHPRHPNVTPVAVALTRDLFNAHIVDPENCPPHLPPIPLICLGPFLPRMRVSDQVVATYDLLRWARISTERPMNEEAAAFARRECARPGRFPVDVRPFWRDEAEQNAAAGTASAASPGTKAAGVGSVGLRLGSEWRAA
jgi:hypothetical protein